LVPSVKKSPYSNTYLTDDPTSFSAFLSCIMPSTTSQAILQKIKDETVSNGSIQNFVFKREEHHDAVGTTNDWGGDFW
jgi:hypothetical protein